MKVVEKPEINVGELRKGGVVKLKMRREWGKRLSMLNEPFRR